MRARKAIRLATSLITAVALSTGPALAGPPPITIGVDPSGRVGRLAAMTGAVSTHGLDAENWHPGLLNAPVTAGASFWTEPDARATIDVAASRLTLGSSTELDVPLLDDHTLGLTAARGELYLDLRPAAGDMAVIQTQRARVTITTPGQYEVIVGDTERPTAITVVTGAAQVTSGSQVESITAHQTASLTGGDVVTITVGAYAPDAFLTQMLADVRPVAPPAAAPPLVAEMTGGEELARYGTWATDSEQGAVWYPPVEPGWVPYRQGRWSYVGPWGWTWVDAAPWGFAPFHYGRWREFGHRWGWLPLSGPYVAGFAYPRPVYAPALVRFLDVAGGAASGFGARSSAGRFVGWVPLGPRELYFPPYRVHPEYIRTINATSIRNVNQTINITQVSNRVVLQTMVNRNATTVLPAAVMASSQPVAGSAFALPPGLSARMAAQAQAPITPVADTAGVTAAVARQYHFIPVQPLAPGPAIQRPIPIVAGRASDPELPRAGGHNDVAAPIQPGGALSLPLVERPGSRPTLSSRAERQTDPAAPAGAGPVAPAVNHLAEAPRPASRPPTSDPKPAPPAASRPLAAIPAVPSAPARRETPVRRNEPTRAGVFRPPALPQRAPPPHLTPPPRPAFVPRPAPPPRPAPAPHPMPQFRLAPHPEPHHR